MIGFSNEAVLDHNQTDIIPRRLLILGFGGHARSVADVALDLGIPDLAFVDSAARKGEQFSCFPVFSTIPETLQDGWAMIPAAGDNIGRQRQLESITAIPLRLISLISRRAYVGFGASILEGSFVAHQAHIGPMVSIGRATIVNTAAVIDHESTVGDFSHISVNATVAGRCNIGSSVFLGAGATVIDKVRVVDHVIIAAGATVVDDITEPGTYIGSPARLKRS